MEITSPEQPRRFSVGKEEPVEITDCADIALAPDEQVTFTTPGGGELDVVRKSWGFYATPSLNRRLPQHRLHPVLVRNDAAGFLLLVEEGHEDEFDAYLTAQRLRVVCRLDTDAALERLSGAVAGPE